MATREYTPDLLAELPLPAKRCSGCGLTKPICEFYKQSASKDGHGPRCKECSHKYTLEYYQKNGPQVRAMSKAYRDAHKEHYQRYEAGKRKKRAAQARRRRTRGKPRQAAITKAWRLRVRLEAIARYSGGTMRCACCGEATLEFLTLDHIHNDGAIHRRSVKGGWLYSWVRANSFPDGFQVLCYNCNLAKGHYGICPHQRQREQNSAVSA